MTMFIGPALTRATTPPPGISGTTWAYMVSDTPLELTTFLTVNLLTIGCAPTNIRTPLLGSVLTYVGLSAAQRTAAITAGAQPAPTDNLCRAQGFDCPDGAWE